MELSDATEKNDYYRTLYMKALLLETTLEP